MTITETPEQVAAFYERLAAEYERYVSEYDASEEMRWALQHFDRAGELRRAAFARQQAAMVRPAVSERRGR